MLEIEALVLIGLLSGLAVGSIAPNQKTGCVGLLFIPLGMIGYIGWWQEANLESLRSTSGLDFLFGPIWPSIGGIIGFYLAVFLREWLTKERRN